MKIANSDNHLTSSISEDELDTAIINLYKQRRPLPKPPLITLLEKILDKPIKLGEKIAHEDTIGEAVTAFATNINYYAMAGNLLSWLGTHPRADEAYDYWVKRAEDELNDKNMEDAGLAMQTASFLFILKEISIWYIDLKNEASHKIDDTLKILDILKPILLPGFGMKIYESSTLAKIDKEIEDRRKFIESFKEESTFKPSLAENLVKKAPLEASKNVSHPFEKINQWHSDNKIDELLNLVELKIPFLKEEIEKLKPFDVLKRESFKSKANVLSYQPLPIPTNLATAGINPSHVTSSHDHYSPTHQHSMNSTNMMSTIAAIPPAHSKHFSNSVGMFSSKSPHQASSHRQYSAVTKTELPPLKNLTVPNHRSKAHIPLVTTQHKVSHNPTKNISFNVEIVPPPQRQQYECFTVNSQNYKKFLYASAPGSFAYFSAPEPGTYCRPAGSHEAKFYKKTQFDLGKRI